MSVPAKQPVIRDETLVVTNHYEPPTAFVYFAGDEVAQAVAVAIWNAQLVHAQATPAYQPVKVSSLDGVRPEELKFAILIISANQPGVSAEPAKQFIAGGTKKAPTCNGVGDWVRETLFLRSDVKVTAAQSIASKVAGRFSWNYKQTLRERAQQQSQPAKTVVTRQLVMTVAQTVARTLNEGPNFRGEMASASHGSDLPRDQRFSWALVPDAPIRIDRQAVLSIEYALVALQKAVSKLAMSRPAIFGRLAQGVNIKDPQLLEAYLKPPTDHYDLTARSDLHYSNQRLVVGEIDEMPGGEGLSYLVDKVYGVNKANWLQRFAALASEGPVLWVLADWSSVYETELGWLVSEAQKLGFPFRIATKSELSAIQVDQSGVRFRGEQIGRVRRLFAIWEPDEQPVLKELVFAAQKGLVQLDQPFGWFGNKALFALFYDYQAELSHLLGKETMDLLLESVPHTRFIENGEYPRSFSEDKRAVMKIIGANDKAARSYGVTIFKGLSATKRVEWMLEHLATPLIRQECFDYDRVPLSALDTRTGTPFAFQKGRLMVRPWRTGNQLTAGLSMVGEEYKVHGGVGTATVSTDFVD